MKNVLIISPRFPPLNAADHQRVRMALPYFREYDWEPTVLCVDAQFVEASQDLHKLQSYKVASGSILTSQKTSCDSQKIIWIHWLFCGA